MKKIEAYSTKNEAIRSLDNGGRFYNLLTKADDGVIEKEELSKVAGLFNDKQKMVLFLEMSISKLIDSDKESIISTLDEDLQKTYYKYKSQHLLPSEANSKGILASNAFVTGFPKLIESKSDFGGFIMFPIISGNVTTFMMIPIVEQYDIYEIRDEKSSETFLIAHTKDSKKLPEEKLVIGGVLKELNKDKKDISPKEKFLEANYYMKP